jgi:flagellum-specific peptidoglycan hydrolase FlgJ
MKAQAYINKYLPEAKKVEKETGISAIAMLAQSAGEGGWKEGPGNMMFGIKDTDGINENEQLIRTTEYLPIPDHKFPVIHSVTRVKKGNTFMYKYDIEDYFRKYDTPADSFRHYTQFIFKNPRYKKALEVRNDPEAYLRELARANYATNPDYEEYMMMMLKSVIKRLPKRGKISINKIDSIPSGRIIKEIPTRIKLLK